MTTAERGRDALKGQEKGTKKPHPVRDAVFVWRGAANTRGLGQRIAGQSCRESKRRS